MDLALSDRPDICRESHTGMLGHKRRVEPRSDFRRAPVRGPAAQPSRRTQQSAEKSPHREAFFAWILPPDRLARRYLQRLKTTSGFKIVANERRRGA